MTRMNKRQHDYFLPQIVEIQNGRYCKKCHSGKGLTIGVEYLPELFIDHIDNNNNNNRLENLQLLCRSCNTKKNHPRTTEPTIRNAPPEYTAGKRNFKLAKKYIEGRMYDPEEGGKLKFDDLVDDVANFVDCSQTQVKNYLAKLCSKKHGLMTTEESPNGEIYLVWKSDEELDEVVRR